MTRKPARVQESAAAGPFAPLIARMMSLQDFPSRAQSECIVGCSEMLGHLGAIVDGFIAKGAAAEQVTPVFHLMTALGLHIAALAKQATNVDRQSAMRAFDSAYAKEADVLAVALAVPRTSWVGRSADSFDQTSEALS